MVLIPILILFSLTFFYCIVKKKSDFPPGPSILTVVANLAPLAQEPYKVITKMRETYGDLIGIQVGSKRTLFINDLNLMKDAFGLKAFSGRPSFKHILQQNILPRKGILYGEGAEWMEQRRFVLKNLRNFGFGKKSIERLMTDDIVALLQKIGKTKGTPLHPHDLFGIPIFNPLWTLATGQSHSHDDTKLNKLLHLLATKARNGTVLNAILPFQWLSYLSSHWSGLNENMKKLIPIYDFIQNSINFHEETYQVGVKRDLIDCYLEETRKPSPHPSFLGQSGSLNIYFVMFDLFLAGAETITTILIWTCFLLSHFPEVQEKLHESIIEGIGITELPSLHDESKLPYVKAFVMEILRFATMGPLAIPHKTVEDVHFHGYFIPKDTYVFGNLYCVSHDPKIWGDPQNFRPERFLSEDGATILKHKALIPFSVGKRMCLAETMVTEQLFLFIASIFQHFKVDFDRRGPIPEPSESVFSQFIRSPKYHRLIFSERSKYNGTDIKN